MPSDPNLAPEEWLARSCSPMIRMHRGRTDHGGSVSSAGPGWRTGDAALRVGAVLPQLLESAVLQDVDVTDRQPGLGRDLVNGPTLDIPAVDNVRLALVELRPCLPHHFAPGFQRQPAAPIWDGSPGCDMGEIFVAC